MRLNGAWLLFFGISRGQGRAEWPRTASILVILVRGPFVLFVLFVFVFVWCDFNIFVLESMDLWCVAVLWGFVRGWFWVLMKLWCVFNTCMSYVRFCSVFPLSLVKVVVVVSFFLITY